MKVTGPGSGAPTDAAKPAEEAGEAAKQPAGAGFASKLGEARPPEAAAGTADPRSVHGVPKVADIGADLQAGRITPEAAIDRVIERVIDRQLGTQAPAAVREKLNAALRQALEDDPLLAQKIKALR
jgi:hypothetical protein